MAKKIDLSKLLLLKYHLFLPAVFVLLISTGCSNTPVNTADSSSTSSSVNSYPIHVAVLGDSISAGINPDFSAASATYGWVDMIAGEGGTTNTLPESSRIDKIWSTTNVIITNFAVSGYTAYDENNWAYLQNVTNFNPDIAIVFIGGNDVLAAINSHGNLSLSEAAALSNNVAGIIEKLQMSVNPPKILVAGYYDLCDGYSANLTSIPSLVKYTNLSAITVECNGFLYSIANSYGCFFADNYTNFLHHCYGYQLGDSSTAAAKYVFTGFFDIHPVTAGHLAIANKISAVLKQMTN